MGRHSGTHEVRVKPESGVRAAHAARARSEFRRRSVDFLRVTWGFIVTANLFQEHADDRCGRRSDYD
jgi:hypothetical protein